MSKEQLTHLDNEPIGKRPENGKDNLLWSVAKHVPMLRPLLLFAVLTGGAGNAQSVEQDPTPSPTTITAEGSITDQNGDGFINLVDARILTPPQTADCPICVDVNDDMTVDDKDVDLVQSFTNSISSTEATGDIRPYKAKLDVNFDEIVDDTDVDIITNYVGRQVEESGFGLDKASELISGFMANDIVVRFKPDATEEQKQALYSKYNLTQKTILQRIPLVRLQTAGSDIEQLQKTLSVEPIVDSVQKNHLAELLTDDPRWIDQWGHKKIRIEQAWFTESTGNSNNRVRVGIIDTGVDYSHEDLQRNLSTELRRDVTGSTPIWTFDNQDLTDDVGHGTFIAGIIGATVNNNKAIAGLNWDVEIIPVKACLPDPLTGGSCPTFYIYQALDWLSFQEVDVVNMSFGSGYFENDNDNGDYYLDLMQELGVILIGGAGNNGRNDCVYPAAHAGVVCVGATDQNDALAANSSGRQDADIFAPGVSIISTVPPNSPYDSNGNGVEILPNGGAGSTSFAAAYVSGIAALCKTVTPISPDRNDLRCDKFFAYDTNGFGRIDAWAYLWYRNCSRFDNNDSKRVNLHDLQLLAFRINNPIGYRWDLDIYPVGGDGKIDISDYYVEASRYGAVCQ